MRVGGSISMQTRKHLQQCHTGQTCLRYNAQHADTEHWTRHRSNKKLVLTQQQEPTCITNLCEHTSHFWS